jgi:hypothetical protein
MMTGIGRGRPFGANAIGLDRLDLYVRRNEVSAA